MSLGVGTLNTNQKRDPAGPPFVAGSAVNGLSLDALGRIVLGNDSGDVTQPAILLNNREIPLDSFVIQLIDTLAGFLQLSANEIIIERDFTQGRAALVMQNTATGDIAQIIMDPGSNVWNILVDFAGGGHGEIIIDDSGRVIAAGNILRSVGHSVQLGNGGGLNSSGGVQLWRQTNLETASRGIAGGEAYYIFTNIGAAAGIALTLPACAAGQVFEFYVADANGITITAPAGQTIRIGDAVTAAGGSISSVVIGSYIKLAAVDDTTGFVASGVTSLWVIAGGLRVGEVPFRTLTGAANLNFPNTAAQTSSDLTIAVAGAVVGNAVEVGIPAVAQAANICITAFVSAAGVVTVRLNNYSAAAVDIGAGDYTVIVKQLV